MLRSSEENYVSSGHARCVSFLFAFFGGLDIKYIASLARTSRVWAQAGRAVHLPREVLATFLGYTAFLHLLGPDREDQDSDDDALPEVS